MTKSSVIWRIALALLVFCALLWTGIFDPLLFHTVVEILVLVICFSIFVVAWYSRNYTDNGYFTFLGIAYLFIGILELAGALSMDGLPFFTGFGSGLDSQLWIVTRYMQALSFITANFFIYRRLRVRLTMAAYLGATVLVLLSIFVWQIFPQCYIDGPGWTLFNVISEFIIAAIFAVSGVLLWLARSRFDRTVVAYLLISVLLAIIGIFSRELNHLLYLASFFMVFRAIVVNGLLKPYDVLFRNLAREHELLEKERDHLQNLMDIEESLLVALDNQGRITLVNRKAAEVLGYNEAELTGKPWFSTCLPERLREKAADSFQRLVAGEVELVKHHLRPVLTSSGEERIIAWNNAIIRDHSGSITGTFSSGQDITGQKQAEDLFRTTFNRSPVGLYIAVKGKFVLVNPQFCKWAGYSEQELEGKETLSLVYPEDMGRVRREAIRSLKSSREHVHSYDYRFKTHDGHIRWFMESVTSIRFNGRPATLGSIVDISERKDNEELFRSLSMVDDLTGLYNRRGFLTLASKELQLSFRLERGASILFADVDKLKSINDGFGHLEGDAALISAARMLKEAFRESDIIGRIMGDEFAVFMLGADQEYASGIIARMQARLQEYNSTSGKPYQLTLSFGLATSPAGKPCNLGDLLQTADRYMYRQKRNGN